LHLNEPDSYFGMGSESGCLKKGISQTVLHYDVKKEHLLAEMAGDV
jgi:hypothetical protein